LELAKKKAAAAAKAKAAAQAKQKREETDEEDLELAKKKAAAAAKAKALAIEKAKSANMNDVDHPPQPEEIPSPNQPFLDQYVSVIRKHLNDDAIHDYYINRLSKHVPTLVANDDTYFQVAQLLKNNEELAFDYLSELHGTDFQTHFELYVHLFSSKHKQSVALKVKVNREQPVIDSLQPLWNGADWPEREAFDLLGIQFTGHPNLKRIMLTDDWVGYPLRKDYEAYDVEV
ncbi:NADH-quinone oxidoreductase subunit C, partial [Metabacillus iocasae]